jgi:molecular chaperone GrpE
MILGQFKDVLSNNGVIPFNSTGTHFDPHKHEAIETLVSNDYAPGTVVSESVRGYKMGDRIIRPARVTVAKQKIEEKPQQAEKNNDK